MPSGDALRLYVPRWRLELLFAALVVYSLVRLVYELNAIETNTSSINAALRAEFDSTETPPSEEKLTPRPSLGSVDDATVDEEDG